jgi:hypothetical protein
MVEVVVLVGQQVDQVEQVVFILVAVVAAEVIMEVVAGTEVMPMILFVASFIVELGAVMVLVLLELFGPEIQELSPQQTQVICNGTIYSYQRWSAV